MKQRAHAWVALRAIKRIDDWGGAPKLVETLTSYMSDVWDGAWLPDIKICDTQYGHIFKQDTQGDFITNISSRFQMSHDELDKVLVGKRHCLDYIEDAQVVDEPYRSHPKIGGHLPNRVIALSHMIGDMLKLCEYPMAKWCKVDKPEKLVDASGNLLPYNFSSQRINSLSISPDFSPRQVAVTFFILSHYIADVHMPLHCDLRDYSAPNIPLDANQRRLDGKLHPNIEVLWETCFPLKRSMMLSSYTSDTLDQILVDQMPDESLIEIDDPGSPYSLDGRFYKTIKGDEWEEMVYVSRVSFAMARKWIKDGPGGTDEIPSRYSDFKEKALNPAGEIEFFTNFKDVTNAVFHDTVEAISRIWVNAWLKFIE